MISLNLEKQAGRESGKKFITSQPQTSQSWQLTWGWEQMGRKLVHNNNPTFGSVEVKSLQKHGDYVTIDLGMRTNG